MTASVVLFFLLPLGYTIYNDLDPTGIHKLQIELIDCSILGTGRYKVIDLDGFIGCFVNIHELTRTMNRIIKGQRDGITAIIIVMNETAIRSVEGITPITINPMSTGIQ